MVLTGITGIIINTITNITIAVIVMDIMMTIVAYMVNITVITTIIIRTDIIIHIITDIYKGDSHAILVPNSNAAVLFL
jgi:hypothetical protein